MFVLLCILIIIYIFINKKNILLYLGGNEIRLEGAKALARAFTNNQNIKLKQLYLGTLHEELTDIYYILIFMNSFRYINVFSL